MKMRLVWVFAAVLLHSMAIGARELPEVPAAPHFIRDEMELVNAADAEATEQICTALLAEKSVPLAVLTVESVSMYNGGDVESLAAKILQKWRADDATRDWGHGALILVAKADRKVRVQLGITYQHRKDAQCDLIMNQRIVPSFKTGAFSAGIRGGAEALASLLRDGSLPLDVQPAEAAGAETSKPPAKVYSTSDTVIGFIFLGIMGVGVILFILFLFVVARLVIRGILSMFKRMGGGRSWSSSSYDSSSTSYYDSSSSSSSSSDSSSSSSSSDGGGSTGSW